MIDVIDDFFHTDDWAETVTFHTQADDVSVSAIFDKEYLESLDMSGFVPKLTVSTSGISTVKKGHTCTVRSQEYVVSETPQDDGTGVSVVMLEKSL